MARTRRSLASVISLLFARGPSAIARTISAIVVDAFQRVLRRWLGANIGEKLSRVVRPLSGDSNSPSAVVSVAPLRWIQTSVPHRQPNVIERVPRKPVRGCEIAAQASAAFGLCVTEWLRRHDSLGAARASADPSSGSRLMVAAYRSALQYSQAAENLTNQVNAHRSHYVTSVTFS